MNPDVALVIAVLCAAMAVPSLLSAFSEGRAPRLAAILAIAAGGVAVYAINARPGGYTFGDVPAAFVRVVDMVVN